jgi:hypothetical protein
MHENKIGIILEDLSASQLSYYVIKNINEYVGSDNYDFVIFFENSATSILQPDVSIMSISEIWGFDGTLISTSISTTLSMINTFAKSKYFYVWDLEWVRGHGKDFHYLIQAYNNKDVELIARSKEHALAVENYCNRKVDHVINNFDLKKIMRTINEQICTET